MKHMKFSEDKFVDGKLAFEKDKVHEVADGSVERWVKRGGVVVDAPTLGERLVDTAKHALGLDKPAPVEPVHVHIQGEVVEEEPVVEVAPAPEVDEDKLTAAPQKKYGKKNK